MASGSEEPQSEPVTLGHVLTASGETKEERELRIGSLFSFFDSNNLGYLDSALIQKGLSAMQIPADYKFAKGLLEVCDANHDGTVDYQEFKRYMDDKELELYKIFQGIDVEHNGSISPEELLDALMKAGIVLDDIELASFVDHVDKDSNGVITFEEWRDFLLFYPHEATMDSIYQYWERVYLVDIGEQAVIPAGISKHDNPFKYLIAGGVAGVASRTATAPLDRIKIVLQVQVERASISPAVKMIWKEGGLKGFFRGNGLNVVKVTPEKAIKFYTFEMLKSVIGGSSGEVGTIDRLLAGGLAGAVAQTAIYPMELVKTRLQTYACDKGNAPNLWKFSKDILVHEGPRAFYRGLIPSLLGIIPFAGIELATYGTLKDMSRKYILHDSEPGPLVHVSCGPISAALGATCVYPLQLVRTRMQARRTQSYMSEVFRETYCVEGLRGFYKGLLPNLVKVLPAASIYYMVYEAMKKSFDLN